MRGAASPAKLADLGPAAPPVIGCCALIAAALDHDVGAASVFIASALRMETRR
jgi:hypothetical protein